MKSVSIIPISVKPDRHAIGNEGEKEVIARVPCIVCGAPYVQLPTHYPLYDLVCADCGEMIQVKTINPKGRGISVRTRSSYGGGWKVLKKLLDAGRPVPPLIVNFKWTLKDGTPRQEMRLYLRIPVSTLRIYALKDDHKQRGYLMYRYRELDILPYTVLYEN